MASHEKEAQPRGERRKATYGGRKPMPLEERAKIFSPFDPLDGFREALRAKEREVEAELGKSVHEGPLGETSPMHGPLG